MEFAFIDETSDIKFKNYFGICCATVNHTKYRTIKAGFQKILRDGGWDPEVEFKGSYLFSASKGCPEVSVEERIALAEKILRQNESDKNARLKFAYLRLSTEDVKTEYLRYLPGLLGKVLPRATKKPGKDLVSIQCDYRNDITSDEVCNSVKPLLDSKGYTLFEDVELVKSNFETVGVLYADIVAYLVARVDVISSDYELFDGITAQMAGASGKIRKLRSSVRLINFIKKLDIYSIQ